MIFLQHPEYGSNVPITLSLLNFDKVCWLYVQLCVFSRFDVFYTYKLYAMAERVTHTSLYEIETSKCRVSTFNC